MRRDADLTQDDLAAILNINKHSISSYERNKSEPPDAIKIFIARCFGVSVDYLIGLTDDPAPVTQRAPVLRLPAGFPREAGGADELCCISRLEGKKQRGGAQVPSRYL